MQKNDAQISFFFTVVKKLQVTERKCFGEKGLSSFFLQIRSSKRCSENFIKTNGSLEITFGDFAIPKNCSSQQNY